ncbi:MAG: hypothetical protein IKG01_10140 [Lachnospiraceae bacterium]|nr:hypothetical protein [Lachnospiraceae bacterium]
MKDTRETNTTNSTDELLNAVKVVQAAIKAKEDRYRKIASTEEQDPILIEGETRTGYDCQLMVDPKDVAQVFLDYDFALWDTVVGEVSDSMWDRLAEIYGLDRVYSVDLK